MRGNRVLDGSRHRRDGGQMKYQVGAAQGGLHGGRVANVGLVPLDSGTDVLEILRATSEQIVDDAHLAVALREQGTNQRGADETGAAGYDITCHESTCPGRSLRKKAKTLLAADKRRLTPIENNELKFVLYAFIRVHPRPNGLFQRAWWQRLPTLSRAKAARYRSVARTIRFCRRFSASLC